MINKMKRAFVLGLTALVLFTGVKVPTVQAADSKPVHTVAQVSGKATKQTVTYTVNIDQLRVTDGRVAVTYDPEVLTLKTKKEGIRFYEKDINTEYTKGEETGLSYAFINEYAKKAKGSLLTLTFAVNSKAEGQDTVVKTEVFQINNEDKEVVSNVVLEDSVSVGRPKPSKPANVSLRQTLLGVGIGWNRDQNADGYLIYRSTKENGGYRLIGQTNLTIFWDAAVRNNQKYYYKVQAYQNKGNEKIYSEESKPVSITVRKFFGIFG